MTKALVTGASGFIGLHLVKALQTAAHDVTCLVRPSSSVASLEAAGVRLVRGDITDRQSLRGCRRGTRRGVSTGGLPPGTASETVVPRE